jgi:hydroxysqualene synthase
MRYSDSTIRSAYAECRKLARHYENFPVASLLVPADRRDALAAIYAFARTADDFADEPGVEGRLAKLAEWRSKLQSCLSNRPKDAIFLALSDAMHRFSLSYENFEKLICAFESDVRVNRHSDFASLLDYCRCSANPVGRLVLELFGHHDDELFGLADKICTALQLTNFWQDVAIDLSRDRIYLPLADLERFELSVVDLQVLASSDFSSAHAVLEQRWRGLMAFQIERTRELFAQGRILPERVVPELRRQLRLTWLGGTAILRKIESVGYDVFRQRPTLSKLDFVRLYFKARRAREADPPRDPYRSDGRADVLVD